MTNSVLIHPADQYLFDAAAGREIDRQAMAQLQVPGFELMRRAAQSAFAALLRLYPNVSAINVWCGKGNNAGDAYLLAKHAHQYGIETCVVAIVDPLELTGDAALACDEARDAGVTLVRSLPEQDHQSQTQVVQVDGLLGTGLNRPPSDVFQQAIGKINGQGTPILSIDVPSGVDASTGAVATQAVKASLTVSFITRKVGLYTGPGVSYAGQREFSNLGVPAQAYRQPGVRWLHWDPQHLLPLDENTYKHRRGHVVVAGGDDAMPGAVALAALSALRVGAGMVTVLTKAQHAAPIVARVPEAMVQAFRLPGEPGDAAAVEANEHLARADLVVLGPGLGRGAWSEALYLAVEASRRPTVLDADGLYWLAQRRSWRGGDLTITPHVAEAARLLAVSAQEVQHDRLSAGAAISAEYSCRGVLKGAGSVIFDTPDSVSSVCAHGNPGMASAGMGDVLSGIVGGLLAELEASGAGAHGPLRGRCLADAVALHSAAGDAVALQLGARFMLASDVIEALRPLMGATSASSED